LKSGSGSLKVIKTGTIRQPAYALATYSIFVSKMHRYWDIRLRRYRYLV